jgi:hypothetical protein
MSIFSAPAEKFINPIAIAPVFDALDRPQNKHYCTNAHDRRYENAFGDQRAHRHKEFWMHRENEVINGYYQLFITPCKAIFQFAKREPFATATRVVYSGEVGRNSSCLITCVDLLRNNALTTP